MGCGKALGKPAYGTAREREGERERERRKGRGVATHAPLPWDTTPGKDVVTSARTPERTEMRPDGAGDGSGEASLRRCGRNLSISGWGGGGLLGGKPAYGTAVGIFTSPDGMGEG